jgi:DNA helicase-2/ATP-dependent DNA helicase PcrA
MSTLLVSVRDLEARDPLVDVGDFLTEVERRAADEAAGTSGGVNLLTYHRAKGLEWEAVFLPAVEEGLLPIRQASGPDAIDEERRLLYVGITRARRHLWISWAGRREGPSGKETSRRRSRFLDEVLPRPVPSARPRAGRTLAASGIGIGAGARPLSEVMPPPPKAPTDRSPTSVALRAWRLERARTDGVAAFVILHDSTLELIAERQPRSLAELRRIPGIGPQKLDRYGAEIIDAIERAT